MKTTLLFSAAILFSAATFAQTTVKNQEAIKTVSTVKSQNGGSEVHSSGSTSTATEVQSNAVNKTGNKADAAAEKGKTQIVTEKEALATKAKTETQQAKNEASHERAVSAETELGTKIAIGDRDNKIDGNTSLNSDATVSSIGIKNNGNMVKEKGEISVGSGTTFIVATGNQVKSEANKSVIKTGEKINAFTVNTIKAGSSTTHSIKQKSPSVKTTTLVKTNSGISIK